MSFQYVHYHSLKQFIVQSIATEIKYHNINEKDQTKALRKLYLNHPERATQCRYLLAVIYGLNQPKVGGEQITRSNEEKTIILNAAVFYIRNQISESYCQGIATIMRMSPENSNLYNSLSTSLVLTKENLPDSSNVKGMYSVLSDFMRTHIYKGADPEKGYLDEPDQCFSSKKIKGYNVEDTLADLLKKITELQLEQIDLAKEYQLAKVPDKRSEVHAVGLFADKNKASVTMVSSVSVLPPTVQTSNF